MMDVEALKDKILRQNYDYDNFIWKFKKRPLVLTTAELADPDLELNYKDGVAIETWVSLHLLGIIAFSMITSVVQPFIPSFYAFIGLCLSLYLIYRLFDSFHSQIIINGNGISIGKQKFEWKDIQETFVISEVTNWDFIRSKSPGGAYFLVIADKFDLIKKFEITFIGVTPVVLATAVEYFKKRANEKRLPTGMLGGK